jgi:hypothetical protein
MRDYIGNNTARAQRKQGNQWFLRVALFVIGFTLFTMIIWSV